MNADAINLPLQTKIVYDNEVRNQVVNWLKDYGGTISTRIGIPILKLPNMVVEITSLLFLQSCFQYCPILLKRSLLQRLISFSNRDEISLLKKIQIPETVEIGDIRVTPFFKCHSIYDCNLSEKHITKDDNGIMWIKIERQKTKSECRIRLLSVPLQIMEKYKHERTDDKIFKLKTLKTIDENLKTIAQKCGIESRLCYHMARHTYATTVCL